MLSPIAHSYEQNSVIGIWVGPIHPVIGVGEEIY